MSQPDTLQALAQIAEARRIEVIQESARKRWRLICGELYMMQQTIRREQMHTAGTGTNV